MKTEKRSFLIVSLVAALVLVPMGVYGKEEASGPPPTTVTGQMSASAPPVEQPLVPEGVFAVQLVEALKVGRAQDEAQAESMLSAIGIEPKNGWIAGYPVTPPVIVEIEKGVAGAADAGKLGMGKEQALKAVGDLKTRLGLSVTAEAVPSSAIQAAPSGRPASTVIYKYIDKNGVIHYTDRYETIPKEYRDQIEMIRETAQPQPSGEPASEGIGEQANNYIPNPNPEVINNYYYTEGPPVVTYYPPPGPYYYLYSWVPYPFWCSGFFFRGFFVLHDFHRHIYVNSRPFVVTNHVVNAANHKVFIVDPVSRGLRGGTVANGVTSPQVFNSSRVQTSARAIVGLSQGRMGSANVSTAPRTAGVAPSNSPFNSMSRPQGPTRTNQGTFNGPVSQPRNNFVAPQVARSRPSSPAAVNGRSFSSAPARVFSPPPSFSQARVFSGTANSGGRGSFDGSRGGGSISGRGGSRGGGAGGHR